MSATAWPPFDWGRPVLIVDGIECTADSDYLAANCGPPPPADPALAELVRTAVAEALAAERASTAAAGAGELRAYVTIAEARALLRCSDRHIRRLIATGELASVRRVRGGSSRVLIPRESLTAFVTARRVG